MATIDVSMGFPQNSIKYTYLTTGAQDWIKGIQPPFTVAIFPSGGAAKIEYTYDKDNLGTTTDVLDWPSGSVAVGTDGAIYSAVAAIRCNVTSGTCVMYISGMVKP